MELTRLEEELSQEPKIIDANQDHDTARGAKGQKTAETNHLLSREMLLKLLDMDPELAVIMIQIALAQE